MLVETALCVGVSAAASSARSAFSDRYLPESVPGPIGLLIVPRSSHTTPCVLAIIMDDSELYDDFAVEPGEDELDQGILDDEEDAEDAAAAGGGGGSGGSDADPTDAAGEDTTGDSVMERHGEIDLTRRDYLDMLADEDYHANEEQDAAQQRGWRPIIDDAVRIDVNHSIRRQWAKAQEEIPRLVKHVQDHLRASSLRPAHRNQQPGSPLESVDEWDLFVHLYGPDSQLFTPFRDRLGWSHERYLKYMATGARCAANGYSAAQLYDSNRVQSLEGLLTKKEYISCWKEISLTGTGINLDASATAPGLFIDLCQNAFNIVFKKLFIEGATSGNWLNDDDKIHYECPPSKRDSNACGLKIMKFTNDNRWGFTQHALVSGLLYFCANLLAEKEGTGAVGNMKRQLFGSAFGNDATVTPNLSKHELNCDRGYTSNATLSEVFLPSNADLTNSAKRGKHLGYHYGKNPPGDGDARQYVPVEGAMDYQVRRRTYQLQSLEPGDTSTELRTLFNHMLRDGRGHVILMLSTKHSGRWFDFVTVTDKVGRLYHEDREELKKMCYQVVSSAGSSKVEIASIHSTYLLLYQQLPMTMVTMMQGFREWHAARPFCASGTSAYDLVRCFARHHDDEELLDVRDDLDRVLRYLKKEWELPVLQVEDEEDEEEGEREEEEEEGRSDDDDDGDEDPTSDAYLLQHPPTEDDMEDEQARYDYLCVMDGRDVVDNLKGRLDSTDGRSEVYLDALLALVDSEAEKPKSKPPKVKYVRAWLEATPEERPYIIKSKVELRDVYRQKYQKEPTTSWQRPTLIEKLAGNNNSNDSGIETNSPASREYMYGINTCAHLWHAEARKNLGEALSPLSTGELVETGLVTNPVPTAAATAITASSSHSSVAAIGSSRSSAAAATTASRGAPPRASGATRRAQSRGRVGTPPTAQRPRTLDHALARADA